MSKSSKGATSVIRKRLNFNDEHLWRKFSSRRLQLVDALSLSSKKASEQDEEIQICARTLMQEFGFPSDTLGDFDRLVRLAIQSVRRNKRRSEKRQEVNLVKQRINTELDLDDIDLGDDDDSPPSSSASKRVKRNSNSNDVLQFTSLDDDDDDDDDNNNNNNNGQSSSRKSSQVKKHKPEETASRLAATSLVAPFIPTEYDRLPSLKHIYTDPKFHKSANKILQIIKKSRTCFEFSANAKQPMKNDLLEELGSSCIHAAVLLTLERWFDHLLPDSSSYIKMRLKSNHTLATIVKKLDSTSLEVNGLNDYLASSLFKRLIGACAKDFGFDSPLNPLCDIFHNTILKDFPILTRDPTGKEDAIRSTYFTKDKPIIDSILPLNVDYPLSTGELPIPPPPSSLKFDSSFLINSIPSENNIHMPTLPSLIPKQAVSTPVKIKFQQKELTFNYNTASNAPPTLMELISNCKNAFGIVNATRVLHLRDFKTKLVFKSDFELERTLRMNSMWGNPSDEITLELIYTNVVQDYLNLNYDQKGKNLKREESPPLNLTPVLSKAPILPSPLKPVSLTDINKNESNENLNDRYLPLPRPQGPNINKRVMMKFQPLL